MSLALALDKGYSQRWQNYSQVGLLSELSSAYNRELWHSIHA